MRKSCFLIALIFSIPLFSYFGAREYSKSKYQDLVCQAKFSENIFHTKSGYPIKLQGEMTLDFKHDEIYLSFYDFFNKKLKWRGVVLFNPSYDMVGNLMALEIVTINPNVSSQAINNILDLKAFEGGKYPIRIYKVNESESVYFVKYASNRFFCVKV